MSPLVVVCSAHNDSRFFYILYRFEEGNTTDSESRLLLSFIYKILGARPRADNKAQLKKYSNPGNFNKLVYY